MTNSKAKGALVKLPYNIDLCLYLIKEQLKTLKFFDGLQKIGVEDCSYQPHLHKLILESVGLEDGMDETYDFYFKVMEKRSKKIQSDNDSIMTQAFKAYVELVNEKTRRRDIKNINR